MASGVLPQYFLPKSQAASPLWFAGLSKNRATQYSLRLLHREKGPVAATPSVSMGGGASVGWQAPPGMGSVDD
jgi:hypothetical protein